MPEIVVRKRDGLTALVDARDYRRLLDDCVSFATYHKHGLFVADVFQYINGKRKTLGQLHRYVLGVPRNVFVKTRNGNYLDCRRDNLYTVSRAECQSMNPPRTSGNLPTGVRLTPAGYFAASIQVRGVPYFLGNFKTPEKASSAYERAKWETYFGEVPPIPSPQVARLIAIDSKRFIEYCERYLG